MQEWSVIISAIGLAIVTLSSVGGLVWKLSRIELALRSEFAKAVSDFKDEHGRELAEVKAANVKEIGDIKATHAEQFAAIHAKVYQVEIWARDEFVRKGSFEGVIARVERGFSDMKSEIAGRLDKMTERIEHLHDKH